MDTANVMSNLRFNLVLLGRSGAAKSASGNTILGRQAFTSENISKSGTKDVAAEVGDICGLPITVYDTPGFSGTESKEELRKYEEVLHKCESGICAFLMVLQSGRITEEDQETLEKIEELLGEKRMQNAWILFTGDQLKDENKSKNQPINDFEALKKLALKYGDRFHNFNIKEKEPSDQVNSLISKVFMRNLKNLSKKPQQRIPINIQDIPVSSCSSRRIVLLGKSGVGKSAAGNTILGQREFTSVMRMSSVTSECSEAHATVSGRSVSVVDTPGFFDTKMKPEDLMTEIARSVYLSSPGPHAFLIVLRIDERFTVQEQQIPQQIEIMFGQEVLKYSIILFTRGDQIEEQTVEELIDDNSKLRHLVDQCGGRYHILNNKDLNNREQVNDLLQKIDTMIQKNGGGHYSNQMYEDALRFRREEEAKRKAGIQPKLQGETMSQSFKKFFSKYQRYFQMAAFVVSGIAIGALVLTGIGALVGAGVAAVCVGGATLGGSIAGATLSASVGAAAAGAVATGAGIGAGIGASVGAVAGGVAGAVIGVAASEDAS